MRLSTIWFRFIAVAVVLVLATVPMQGQETSTSTVIKQQKFVFLANWIIDYQGNRRQLTPPYTLTVTSDSVVCDLPYQGRLYSTPTPADLRLMSIQFTSKKYRYTVKSGKKSGWDITIAPGDARNVQTLYLNVARKGTASLSIRLADRDQVSYDGQIEPAFK
jgi:hypothetical protein